MATRGAQPEMQTVFLPNQLHAGLHPALVLLQEVSSQGRGLGTASAAALQCRAAHPPPQALTGDPTDRSLWIPAPFPPSRPETFVKH